MEPYIKSLDTRTPIGNLVYKYGEEKYYRGLLTGVIVGIVFTLIYHRAYR